MNFFLSLSCGGEIYFFGGKKTNLLLLQLLGLVVIVVLISVGHCFCFFFLVLCNIWKRMFGEGLIDGGIKRAQARRGASVLGTRG